MKPGLITRGFIPEGAHEQVLAAAVDVLDLHGRRVVLSAGRPANPGGDFGGPRAYDIVDGVTADRGIPGLADLRWAALDAARDWSGLPLVASPHPRSGSVVKRFRSGDSQGWHVDSNPVTALIYLTGGPRRGGELVVLDAAGLAGPAFVVEPSAGDLVVIAGGANPHAVLPHASLTPRVVIGFNLYLAGDTDRPDIADNVVFGGM